MKIVDADGAPLGVGEIGEICMRSPQVVPGYWNDEVATKAAFRDGWFHSGDVGYVDDEGFVYVVDRLKDVVIRGGENVYCVEVEAVLHEHPAVADVAVIGVDERVMGERVCAVVVPRAGADGRPRRPARRSRPTGSPRSSTPRRCSSSTTCRRRRPARSPSASSARQVAAAGEAVERPGEGRW